MNTPDSPTILVVDDEPRNLRLMEAMLIPMGYRVQLAENGEKALKLLEGISPDVILLDVMMPGMDGYEVARQVKSRETTRFIPIVMVTALQEVADRVKALEVGADDFLSKPVDKTELTARVRSLVKVKAYHDHMKDYQEELEAAVEHRTRELKKTMIRLERVALDTVYRLSKAAEYKDEDTGAHIKRMSNYSVAVARQLGFKENICTRILHAAPMHDVGKIGIPDRILLKPGKLTPEEWVIMKQHTTMGGRILENAESSHLRLAEIIALAHHEKWDGSGYPRGLAGRKIPLVGQIVAISDVFDALTSKRPYKEPFSLEKSFAIIREGRGTHFAPHVVDAFFAVEKKILEIKAKFQDDNPSIFVTVAGREFGI